MPLHRHEALRSLSRDHHVALQLARGLQANASPHLRAHLPSGRAALVAYVERIFAEELRPHFDAEDAVIAPAVAGKDAHLDRIMSDIESEHATMAKLVATLPTLDPPAIEGALDRFGHMLEEHVRREEREYYARIQEILDEATLDRLGSALSRHLVYHDDAAPPASAPTVEA
jgi:hypothetical protein